MKVKAAMVISAAAIGAYVFLSFYIQLYRRQDGGSVRPNGGPAARN